VPPEETVRGLLVLRGLSRRLAADAAAMRAAAGTAREQAAADAAEARELARAEAAARTAATALDAELREARRRRAAARDAETDAAQRAAEAAARATDLEGALARLEREAREQERRDAQRAATAAAAAARDRPVTELRDAPRPSPEPGRPGRGSRVLPVAGQVLRDFGTAGEGGPARGITLQAAPGARVVSPCTGRIAFAAPFRSFGRLLIVDCGEGYHFVLGGLERLDVSPGHKVLAGEPVGLLGGASSTAAVAAGSVDGHGRVTLYLELRRRGDPVDPRPWFAARS